MSTEAEKSQTGAEPKWVTWSCAQLDGAKKVAEKIKDFIVVFKELIVWLFVLGSLLWTLIKLMHHH